MALDGEAISFDQQAWIARVSAAREQGELLKGAVQADQGERGALLPLAHRLLGLLGCVLLFRRRKSRMAAS